MTLCIFRPPYSQRSAHDILGEKTARMFCLENIPCETQDLWPNSISSKLNSGRLPFGRRIFAFLIAPVAASAKLRRVKNGDIAWILGPAVPMRDSPSLELSIKNRGARYIFHVMDDWFSLPYYREMALQRSRLADLIVAPTEALVCKIQAEVPSAKVIRLEEPIDVDRVFPSLSNQAPCPQRLVWVGNPQNLRFIGTVAETLHSISKSYDFILRIISARPPEMEFPFSTEWLEYSYQSESALLAGATAGLSPLEDTPYNRAKGIYKVKTYMAAGIPVVGSNIGYQKELIAHGTTGFLCDSDSDWIKHLSALLENPSLAKKMGDQARSVAVSRFSHDAVKDSWVSAVGNLLKG
jgi:glycosyltransferase involved in cell wall biosynthesis